MSSTTLEPPRSLGAHLERTRLQHRARRIERVLVVLRDQRRRASDRGRSPAALDQAIAGFGDELGEVRRRLLRLT
jgi:hypothetical protein